MQMADILTAISTVGFPIVCCGAMFWQYHKQNEKNDATIEKITEALNNNTLAIKELSERMNRDG